MASSGTNSGEKPGQAPLNPEFLKYLDALEKGELIHYSKDSLPAAWTPSPVDLSHVYGVVDPGVVKSYAVRYDLRGQNKSTPVKDQGNCGSSWAFAAFESLESYLMPNEQKDFSEKNMLSHHGFDYSECAGGNSYMAAAYLARRAGPVDESADTYPYAGIAGQNYTPAKNVQQVVFLPARTGYLDNDTLKYFVSTYGAVYASMLFDTDYFNYATNSYYFSGSNSNNHKLAIVGWDDTYSASNFDTSPPGNGAFIVKDSFGTGWAENGYYYISYYDTSLKSFAAFNNAESTTNYRNIRQYDPLGWVTSYGYGDTEAWGAVIFETSAAEVVKAVGFYTTDVNVAYDIYVYTGVSSGAPRSGTLAAGTSGSKIYPGYYTVALDTPVALSSGQRYSVVVKFNNSTYTYPVAVEKPSTGYSSGAAANLGESYISHYGDGWYDRATDNSNGSICIKAFTNNGSQQDLPPFGGFETPSDGASVSSSIAVTGWALDDTGMESIKIYREQGSDLYYIGDAIMIEGARPDIAAAYPGYPDSTRAGWGYMLLSHFLPGSGNGTYKLVAIARDFTGHETTLGTKTIHCDNAHAVKPFGAIDTPQPGETISGGNYRIQGWVLTPQPNKIAENGSTIHVYIDDVYIGHAVYSRPRADIAGYFPAYANSAAAGAYFDINTADYNEGIHSLYWIVTDNAGNADGVGSRFFTIENNLPPDPGDAGKETVEGIDSDGDGVRDDVQRYIALNYTDSDTQDALRQCAVNLQNFILDTNDRQTTIQNAEAIILSLEHVFCARARNDAPEILDEFYGLYLNTPDRILAMLATDQHLGGQTFQIAPADERCSRYARSPNTSSGTCPQEEFDITIFFSNGMFTKYWSAIVSKILMRDTIGDVTQDNEKIQYALSYNENESALTQLVEVLRQEGFENWTAFFHYLHNAPGAPDCFKNKVKELAVAVDTENFLVDEDLRKHVSNYNEAIEHGMKVVVVAHSQGNFYANSAYNLVDSPSMGIVSVANPGAHVAGGGPYTTLLLDVVINVIVRTYDWFTLLPNEYNSTIYEWTSHDFMKSYWFGDRTGPRIQKHIRETITALEDPEEISNQGIITVTLKWGTEPDVDLHIYEPDGNHVYYDAPTGTCGYLDRDDIDGKGPEHYYADCQKLQTGTFRVGVNYYYGNAPETATLNVKAYNSKRNIPISLPTAVGPAGDNSPIMVASIIVTTDENGYFQFSIVED